MSETREIHEAHIVRKKDGEPLRVCPACWLVPPPGALHVDWCGRKDEDEEDDE